MRMRVLVPLVALVVATACGENQQVSSTLTDFSSVGSCTIVAYPDEWVTISGGGQSALLSTGKVILGGKGNLSKVERSDVLIGSCIDLIRHALAKGTKVLADEKGSP